MPGPNGRKFVIRGIENKTNYAMIDLSIKVDPLPSDDDDEEDKDSVKAKSAANGSNEWNGLQYIMSVKINNGN